MTHSDLGLNCLPFVIRSEMLLAPIPIFGILYVVSLLGFNVAVRVARLTDSDAHSGGRYLRTSACDPMYMELQRNLTIVHGRPGYTGQSTATGFRASAGIVRPPASHRGIFDRGILHRGRDQHF